MKNKKVRFILKSEFSKLAKISPGMVSKLVKSGQIQVFKKNGKQKIDLQSKLVKEYLTLRKEKDPSIEFEIAPPEEGKTLEPIATRELSINPTPEELANYSKADLDRLKVIADFNRKEQETAIKDGKLIERSTVEEFIIKIFDLDEKHLLKFGDNVASQASAIVGVSDIPKIRQLADFLNDQVKESLQRSKKEAEGILLNLTKQK